MTDVPDEVLLLAEQREEARRGRDYALADELRDLIRSQGFEVIDTPAGPRVRPAGPPQPDEAHELVFTTSADVPSLLSERPRFEVSVQWVDQGWPGDVTRGIGSFRRRHPDRSIQHVVVDASRSPATTWPDDAEVLRMSPDAGWAAARNGALRRAAGSVILLVDGSIEATGDVITPLLEELAGGSTGVTGPFGVVTGDLREFRESGGPEVDAVEGYLMAFRRELVEGGLRFDEKFKFYRTADLELSFQIRAMGLRATVTPVPVDRHEHRMWANTPEDERARLSKRNFYRFLDKWRGRTDLLIEGRDSP